MKKRWLFWSIPLFLIFLFLNQILSSILIQASKCKVDNPPIPSYFKNLEVKAFTDCQGTIKFLMKNVFHNQVFTLGSNIFTYHKIIPAVIVYEHEEAHVYQYKKLGPLFIPAYGIAQLMAIIDLKINNYPYSYDRNYFEIWADKLTHITAKNSSGAFNEIKNSEKNLKEFYKKYPNIIIKMEQIPMIYGNNEEYTKFKYDFEIDENTKVSVKTDPNTKRYNPGRHSNINDKGNIFLESQGEEKLLIENISMLVEGGEAVYVYSTNLKNIYLITTGYERDYYHLDLDKKEIDDFVIKNEWPIVEWNNIITLVKNSHENIIGVKVTDKCDSEGEQKGKEAQVIDITINDKITETLKSPIPITCSVGMWGMGDTWIKEYKPDISLETIGVENDYSKFYFKFKLLNHDPQGNEPEIVLEKSFYIDISDFNNPQILE